MTTLYSCKSEINRSGGMIHRITKFDDDMNVEASYIVDGADCNCPAGERPSCRHRKMLPRFIARGAVNTFWLLDYERNGWVCSELEEALGESEITEMPDGVERDNLTIAHEVTLPADATGEQVAKAFQGLGGFPWECYNKGKCPRNCIIEGCAVQVEAYDLQVKQFKDTTKTPLPLNRRGF